MLAYKANELISSTEVAKSFGSILAKIANHEVEKIGVLKNNTPSAIILSVEEYERLTTAKYWNALGEKEYLQKSLDALDAPQTKFFSLEEADKLLEKTLSQYEN